MLSSQYIFTFIYIYILLYNSRYCIYFWTVQFSKCSISKPIKDIKVTQTAPSDSIRCPYDIRKIKRILWKSEPKISRIFNGVYSAWVNQRTRNLIIRLEISQQCKDFSPHQYSLYLFTWNLGVFFIYLFNFIFYLKKRCLRFLKICCTYQISQVRWFEFFFFFISIDILWGDF